MLKTGSIILTIWSAMNLFPSLYVVVGILFLGDHPPGLYAILTNEAIESLTTDVLSTADSIGLFANLSVAAFNLLAIVVIWKGLNERMAWAFWALITSYTLAILAGVAADYAVGYAFPEVNIISAVILITGLTLAAIGLFRRRA